jgi:predicted unusual protein kinase regulating ubiquinone biosynthesis (AarF/ABC1/UbiB family)
VAQNNPREHVALLERYLTVAQNLVDVEKELLSSNLWHADLHASNLFIDGNRISGIIDWQDVWAGPLLQQAQPPDLINYQGDILLKRPDNFDDLDVEERTRIKRQIARSTPYQLYLRQTNTQNPRLFKVLNLDHGQTRRLAISFASNTWDDDIIAFREVLINVERYDSF